MEFTPIVVQKDKIDTERRSVSFNTIFQSKADFDREQKYLQNETKNE